MKLPRISGLDAIKAFARIGYCVKRQRGSHVVLGCPERSPLVVPVHRELADGTLRQLIRDAGLTVEQFIELL